MKRTLCSLLACSLLLSTLLTPSLAAEESAVQEEPAATSQPVISTDPIYFFSDVPESYWGYAAIQYMRAQGLMFGTDTKLFGVGTPVTRGEVVQILWRAAGRPDMAAPALDSLFSDVELNNVYSDAVYWARANGITTGYSTETFGTEDSITREQLATIICRYASYVGVDVSADASDISQFTDADKVHDWGMDALGWAVGVGLINGVGNNLLSPEGTATRAQIAQIMTRLLTSGILPD